MDKEESLCVVQYRLEKAKEETQRRKGKGGKPVCGFSGGNG